MFESVASHAYEIGYFLGGMVTGALGGSFITYRIAQSNRVRGSGTIVDQNKARAGGNIVGGDYTTGTPDGPNRGKK